jgi:hypothetical protein
MAATPVVKQKISNFQTVTLDVADCKMAGNSISVDNLTLVQFINSDSFGF